MSDKYIRQDGKQIIGTDGLSGYDDVADFMSCHQTALMSCL